MAYPGDVLQDGREAQRAGPPAEQRGPEAEEGLAAEGLAWLRRIQEADSGAELYDLCLLYKKQFSDRLQTCFLTFNICKLQF